MDEELRDGGVLDFSNMKPLGWEWNGVFHLMRGVTLEEMQSGGWSYSGQIMDADRNILQEASFTCPRCGMTSHHPKDIEQGYCGNCHDWTGND